MKKLILAFMVLMSSYSVHAQWYGGVLETDTRSASVYGRNEGLSSGQAVQGVVVQVRPVALEASNTVRALGAAVGAGLGAHLSRHTSSYAAKAVAVALSTGGGAVVAGQLGRDRAIEVLVRMRDNSIQAITQEADADSSVLAPGVSVVLIATQGRTRVVRLNN